MTLMSNINTPKCTALDEHLVDLRQFAFATLKLCGKCNSVQVRSLPYVLILIFSMLINMYEGS